MQTSLPFSWSTSRLLYLGITLTTNLSDIFTVNYPPTLPQISNLLTQWSSLPLSWIGKINVIKMAILPKILYLFQVLPIPVPAYFLRILQRKALTFIWASLKPHLPKHTLYPSKPKGGLGYPNFTTYSNVAQLAHITQNVKFCFGLSWNQ